MESFCVVESVRISKKGPVMSAFDIPQELKSHIVLIVATDFIEDEAVNLHEIVLTTYQEDHLIVPVVPLKTQRSDTSSLDSNVTISKPCLARGFTDNVDSNRSSIYPTRKASLSMIQGINAGEGNFIFIVQLSEDYTYIDYFLSATIKSKYFNKKIIISVLLDEFSISPEIKYVNLTKRKAEHCFIYRSLLLGSIKLWDIIDAKNQHNDLFCLCTYSNILQFIKSHSTTKYKINVIEFTSIFSELVGINCNLNYVTILAMVGVLLDNFPVTSGDQEIVSCLTDGSFDNIWYLFSKYLKVSRGTITDLLFENTVDNISPLEIKRLFRKCAVELSRIDTTTLFPSYRSCSFGLFTILGRLRVIKLETVKFNATSPDMDLIDASKALEESIYQIKAILNPNLLATLHTSAKSMFDYVDRVHSTIVHSDRKSAEKEEEVILKVNQLRNLASLLQQRYQNMKPILDKCIGPSESIDNQYDAVWTAIEQVGVDYEILQQSRLRYMDLKQQKLIGAEESKESRDADIFRYFWHLNDFQCYLTIRSLSEDAGTPMGYVSHWIGYGGKPTPLSQEKSQELKNKVLPASKFQLRQPQGLAMMSSGGAASASTSTTDSQRTTDLQKAVFMLDSGSNCIQCIRWSEYAEIMITTLDSVPIRFGRGICCLESKYLIVSDCNSNSIKIVTLPQPSKNPARASQHISVKKSTATISSTEPEVALESEIGGSPTGGYRDGSKPLFSGPTGVAVFRNRVIICDRGNHVLRSFEIIDNQVKTVSTIAGRAGQVGSVDGGGRTSLLHFPTAITATSEYVYFTEQGSVPRVRRYDGDLVETLYSGSPLRNLCGICVDEVRGVALICDNIAATIWTLDLRTRHLDRAVQPQDMPPSPPHIMSMTQKETFCPSAIMTVAPGSYLFTDTSRNQVFRYFDPTAANEAVESAAAKYHPVVEGAEAVIRAIRVYISALDAAKESIAVAGKSTRDAKLTVLQENYCREVRRFADCCDDSSTHLWPETVVIFIRNAPSFGTLSYFFDHLKLSELTDDSPLLSSCRSALAEFISNYNFSEPFAEFDKELKGLANIIRVSCKFFRAQELICLVLHDDRFRLNINAQLLALIEVVLDDVKWSLDRNLVADLRREVIRWLHRIVPSCILPPFASPSSFLAAMEHTLVFWSAAIIELRGSHKEGGGGVMPTLLWIVQVHLESLLTQFIESDSHKKIKSSCLIQTLQNLFAICQRGILKPLLAILASSIAATIHTVPLTAVVEAMKESAAHPSSNHCCRDYCFVFQQLLHSLLSYHYNTMTEKVTLRLNAFLTNRKDKIREVTNWDLQVEMLSYEPELWAFAVLWRRHQDFQYARSTSESSEQLTKEKNNQVELYFLADNISLLLEGLFTTFASGCLSIDTLRKIVAAERSLALAWDAMNCLTKYYEDEVTITAGCSQLISSVENEVNGAMTDVQSLLKVVTTLMPSSPLLGDIQYMLNNWSSLIINSIRRLLQVPSSSSLFSGNGDAVLQNKYNYQEKEKQKVMDMTPFPVDLLQALYWLEFCVDKSRLFRLFWNNQSEDSNGDESIRLVSLRWGDLYASLCDREIRFDALDSFGGTMLMPKELMLLYRTANGILTNNNNNDSVIAMEKNLTEDSIVGWTVKPIDNREAIEELRLMVGQWIHVKQVYFGYQELLRTFGYSKSFLDSQAQTSLVAVEQSLHQLISDVNAAGVWEAQDCTYLSQYWQHATLVDLRWLNVSSKLLAAMKANEPLLIWLESIRDDGAFSSSVEVTLGLQEMECPLELWDNHSRRVNEQLMSMLQNVRSYFHRYLYLKKHPIGSVSAFLDIFSSMNNAVDSDIVCSNLEACNSVRIAFMQVIGNSTDGAAPSRLALLYLPKCNSSWVCSKKTDATNMDVSEADISTFVDKQQQQQQQQRPADTVYLKYCVEVSPGPRSPGRESDMSRTGPVTASSITRVDWRWHGLQDLLDFQSTIVLAQSGMQSDSLQMVMNIFIAQFSWIRKLGEILGHLHDSGHFAFYPQYEEIIPVTATVASIQLRVSALESELRRWKQAVDAARLQYYYLNFITIKRCRLLLSVLSHIDIYDNTIKDPMPVDVVVPIRVVLSECISFLNVNIFFDEKLVSDLKRDFMAMWREKLSEVSGCIVNECDEHAGGTSSQVIVGGGTYAATELLLVLGHCINEALAKVPIRKRVMVVTTNSDVVQSESETDNDDDTKLPPASATVSEASSEEFGVFVVHCDSSRECFDSAMSLYASSGLLPEWENCLICEQSTPVEVVLAFLRRWYFAALHSREKSNYSLLQVQQLTYATQSEAISLLNELQLLPSNNASHSNALVLFSFGKSQCQMTARYAHRKKDIPILSETALSNIGVQLQTYGCGVTCHTSAVASAGKSFAIRVKANSGNMKYVHMPINSLDVSGSNHKLVRRLQTEVSDRCYQSEDPDQETRSEESGKTNTVLIHFDLTNSIGSPFNKSLFDICIIGILQDFDGEALFAYDPKNTLIAVEMSQSQLSGPLSVGAFFPISFAKATPETFVVDEETLRAGMGADFSSSLYDALATDLSEPRAPTTAYDRLLYVGNVLHTLDKRNGSFPYNFLSSAATAKLEGPSVYRQLVAAAGLELNPSLSCLWNFINVVYWQIQEMHHPESPLNSACTPDSSSPLLSLEKDQDSKEKIKGELINFITRTAREFATRQAKKRVDPNRIVGLQLKGFSRSKFNQLWIRLRFDNDNQPCFQSSCRDYFLYFRSKSGVWVIDDVIEQSGATYSCTENGDLNSTWISSPAWAECRYLRVHEERGSLNGMDTVTVAGCGSLPPGSSATRKEDGTYRCLPAYDNINGKKHYLKDSLSSNRRHLFFASTKRWQISPVCNEEQGLFIRSTTEDLGSVWEYIPPDIRENSKVTVKYRGEDGTAPTADADSSEKTAEKDDLDIALLGWKESNHECILFSNKTHTVSFLSLNPQRLRRDMHPSLVRHLEQNNIVVGEDLQSINKKYCEILSSLTGVRRSQKEAEQLLNGNFCLTGDAMLKILAIVYRLRCGVPVVLMGECGCGKTMLLAYLCAWLGFQLITLDVHGGTTEQDIIDVFGVAERKLTERGAAGGSTPTSIYVFLDEVNTCAYMGIINEALCHRTINGVRLHEGIRIMAALNPYRTRPAQDISSGLTFRRTLNDTADYRVHDAMSQLVYRVHPIPLSIRDHIFDFGALDEDTERVYIGSMVRRMVVGIDKESEAEMIGSMIHKSQSYVRDQEGDPSVVSLRDVNRCLLLLLWFHEKLGGSEKKEQKAMSSSERKPAVSARGRATVLALAHVYCYRLPTAGARNSFWVQMSSLVKSWGKDAQKFGFYGIGNPGCPQTIISRLQQRFIRSLEIESGIAMNEALTENIYVTIICILNRIPVFIVGKPGSSKTLAIQIIASNLQGKQSPNPLWRNFPAVYIFQYQCSPLSTSASIKYQFDAACSYQQHSLDVITVLLLDEVGLAETSPDMPLKVLHYMLLDPPIAIVGISNWTLDSSKMNRAICLQRPEPTAEDLMFTGRNIVSQEVADSASTNAAVAGGGIPRPPLIRQTSPTSRMQPWLASLARAFRYAYHDQKAVTGGREFIGLRDYYCLLKHLREELSTTQDYSGVEYMNSYLNASMLSKAVARNFGGKPDLMPLIHSAFQSACMPHIKSGSEGAVITKELLASLQPNTIQLIHDNLASKSARHLMLLTSNDAALHILFGCGIIEVQNVNVLVGSRFKEDLHELHLIHQINEVKHAMARGKTVVLLNHDDIYESLYDVLNLRYVMRTDSETGRTRRMLRLAMGPRSQLCPVEEGFKLIVIVNKYHAYDNLDLPLLNRFEKQVLEPSDLLTESLKKTLSRLEQWCDNILSELGLEQLNAVFCGAYLGTLPSLLLYLLHDINSHRRGGISESKDDEVDGQMQTTTESCQQEEYDEDQLLDEAKYQLLRMAFPAPILLSEVLGQALTSSNIFKDRQEYFRKHSDILTLLDSTLSNSSRHNMDNSGSNNLYFVTTKSPVVHFEVALNHFFTNNFDDDTDITLARDDMKLLELALMSSENVFVELLQSFYANSSPSCPKLLVILCDPLECDLCLISHAKFLCAQQKAMYDDARSTTAAIASVSKHIVFILHLPPGVRHRQREFILDYHQPWIYLYVDDLRISADASAKQPELFQLLQLSVADIFSLKLFDMCRMLNGCVTAALARCSAPMLGGNYDNINPVQIMKDLLRHRSFLAFMESYAMECFRDLALRSDKSSLPLHVSVACQDNAVAGTLRQCIQMSLESLLTQSVAHIVRQVDRNFSLRWVHSNIDKLELWLGLTNKLIDRATLGNLCPFVAPAFLHEVDSSVINSGMHGTLVSEFPCSDRIIQLLRNPETRVKVEGFSQSLKDTEKSLQSVLRSFLGDALLVEVENISKLSTKYVHDFVATSLHPFQGLSFDNHLYIFLRVIDATDPTGKGLGYTPSRIQSSFWMNELRIFHLMSLVNSALVANNKLEFEGHELGKILAESIYNALDVAISTTQEDRDSSKAYNDTQFCARFDHNVVTAILATMSGYLTRCLSTEDGTASDPLSGVSRWLLLWDAIEGDLQVLLTMLLDNSNVKEDQNLCQSIRCEVLYLWWGIRLAKTTILEWQCSHDDDDASHIDTLKALIELSITCKPASAQSFMSYANYCKSEMSKWTNFLYSYLSSFVYSEFSYLSKTYFALEFDVYFVELLGDIVVGKFGRSLGHRKLALTLLTELIRANSRTKQLAEATLRKCFTTNITTAQLYLHFLEDCDSDDAKNNSVLITSSDCDNILLLHQSIADDVQFFQLLSTDDFIIFITIKNIRSALNKLAVSLSDYLSNKTENAISVIPFPEVVDGKLLSLIARVPEIHLYLMKILLDISGEDMLLKYLYWEHRPFTLPVGVDCQSSQYEESDAAIADPFPIVFDQSLYIKGSSAILQTISDSPSGLSAADSFDFFKYCFEGSDTDSKNKPLKTALLVAVTSRLLLDPVNIERFQLCREFLLVSYRRLYAVRQSRLDFALPLLDWLIEEAVHKVNHDRSALFQHQLMVHIAVMLILEPDNWLASLLRNPIASKASLLPSFPDSAFYTIMQSFLGREHVGWYTCKNGHPYVVGECTLPMELSFCSDCGAKIGGQNHNIVKGAERMSTHEMDKVTNKRSVGYDLAVATSEKTYAVERTSVLTAQILRYIINSILLLTVSIIPANLQEVVGLLYPLAMSSRDKDLTTMLAELESLRAKDWEAIRRSTGLGEEDLAMGLHLVLHACSRMCKEGKMVLPGIINDHDTRLLFESSFEVCVESVFAASRCRQTIRDAIAKTSRTKGSVILTTCLGKYGEYLFEVKLPSTPQSAATAAALLWRRRMPVTLDVFIRVFQVKKINLTIYPILAVLLEREAELPMVKFIVDILAWHAILFRVFPAGRLTREEASTIKNSDVIAKLPPSEQWRATQVLTSFCKAFNTAFPLVTHLYECNPNPFISHDGSERVDLSGASSSTSAAAVARGERGYDSSGTGNEMGLHTTINFSLPAIQSGETDAAGLCTIRLLAKLEEINNSVVEALHKASLMRSNDDETEIETINTDLTLKPLTNDTGERAPQRKTAVTPALQKLRENIPRKGTTVNAQELLVQQQHHQQQQAPPPLPATNYLTPLPLLLRRLVVYDRTKHLLPLINTFTEESMSYGEGTLSGFNFFKIEQGLRRNLLPTSSTIIIQVRQYQYAGELRKSDGLLKLKQRVKQEMISKALLDQIWNQIDTQHRLILLMRQLEDCITFLTSTGLSSSGGLCLNEDVKLHSYIMDTLLVDPDRWNEVSCPALNQLSLKHIQSLYLGLEEKGQSDPLDTVAMKYREPLPEELEALLKVQLSAVDRMVFLGALRELATQQLSIPTWPVDASLKEYLCYSDSELDTYNWFKTLPSMMQLRHTYSIYHLCSKYI